MRFPLHAALLSSLAATAHCSSFQQQCSNLTSQLNIENATVWFTEYVAAGTNMSFPDTDPTCGRGAMAVGVDFCRVALYTGRFLSTGNGGLNGCLSNDDIAYTVELGFSTVGANNGYNGTSAAPLLNNPDVVQDFAWRSIHTNIDPATLGPADYAFSGALNPSNIRTWSGDLNAVKARGAKILHYHGQQDQIITSEISPRYYNYVAATMNLPSSALDGFYRFFHISGIGHCSGGPVRWVEQDKAPDSILGTAFVNGAAGGQVAFRRRHYKYPLRNTYTGNGNPNDPGSWKCIV
ncbi:hypothetical protein NEMBOFW57_009204 [Staphylotrichum longicolle]|uniref:Carboxylic ester hydrolase n=1 Tax=Staphylotrichum longicolle TaxID=669026 RepID=A0AAD4ESJ9_9PEZI|nr:hypothetical protein NEMBOFW57_009204 [Staphylotrichum longicolle]